MPGLICQACSEKIDKFVKFREQIENSYYLLCQCVGVDPNETDNSNFIQIDPGPSTDTTVLYSPTKIINKEKEKSFIKYKSKDHVDDDEVANSISSLFKDHLVSGISSSDLLVNPQDGYINVNNVSYSEMAEDADVYKNSDNYMSIGLSEEGIVDSQQSNLLSKDLNSVLSNGDNINLPDSAFNIKLHDGSTDPKIYNISFSDNNSEALQDIFQVLDNDEDGGQNGFDDITKFLKSSQNIDFKKLKEEIKIIKDKNERIDCDAEIDPDSLIKKLASRGVTFVKKEDAIEEVTPDNFISDNLTAQMSSNTETITEEYGNIFSLLTSNETAVPRVPPIKFDETDNETPDIVFARMLAKERETYTKALVQDELTPRITKISSILINESDNTQVIEGCGEKQLLKFRTYMCHLCLMEFRECDMNILIQHSESHFICGNTSIPGVEQNRPLFRCEFCAENFNDRHLFIIHQRKHLGIRPFDCVICYKSFALMEKLSEHMANHVKVNSDQYPCFCCGQILKKKQDLLYHERTHFVTAPLVCTTCNKTFSNIETLKMHRKRHTEGSKHCCEKCGKAFFSNNQLKRHEQSHLGVRRFPCNFCTKAFYSNAERRRHLLYHFKTKKFKCMECDKAFYESGHLTIHMRTHTNFKPYICDVCGKGFPTRVKLMRHLKMHAKHNQSPAEIRDKLMLKQNMPEKVPAKTKVTPKFTKLNPANKKVGGISILGVNSSSTNSIVSMEVLNNLGLENLQDDEDESYIIIEGDDSNGEDATTDLSSFNGVQVFTDDNGQVFYVLDDEEFTNLSTNNVEENDTT